jgi:hypothetical protein
MSKKLIIPKQQFADMSIYSPEYQVRFRLISEDRNSFSAWSPVYNVNPDVTFIQGSIEIPGTIQLNKNTGYVSAVWSDVSIYKTVDGEEKLLAVLPYYDVWIQLAGNGGSNPSEWIYKGRISSTSLNIGYASTYPYTGGTGTTREMTVEIYRPGRPVVQDSASDFLMYSSTITTL